MSVVGTTSGTTFAPTVTTASGRSTLPLDQNWLIVIIVIAAVVLVAIAIAVGYIIHSRKFRGKYRPSEEEEKHAYHIPVPITQMLEKDTKELLI